MALWNSVAEFFKILLHSLEFHRPWKTMGPDNYVSASEGAGPRKVLDDATAGSVVSSCLLQYVFFILLTKIVNLIAKIRTKGRGLSVSIVCGLIECMICL